VFVATAGAPVNDMQWPVVGQFDAKRGIGREGRKKGVPQDAFR